MKVTPVDLIPDLGPKQKHLTAGISGGVTAAWGRVEGETESAGHMRNQEQGITNPGPVPLQVPTCKVSGRCLQVQEPHRLDGNFQHVFGSNRVSRLKGSLFLSSERDTAACTSGPWTLRTTASGTLPGSQAILPTLAVQKHCGQLPRARPEACHGASTAAAVVVTAPLPVFPGVPWGPSKPSCSLLPSPSTGTPTQSRISCPQNLQNTEERPTGSREAARPGPGDLKGTRGRLR